MRFPGDFVYRIPAGGLNSKIPDETTPTWMERKLAVLVGRPPEGSNRFALRTGFGLMRRGWMFSLKSWCEYSFRMNCNYQKRADLISAIERLKPGSVDLFGQDWDQMALPPDVQNTWKGPWKRNKLQLLPKYKFTICFENCTNHIGYISEKIFDAFLAGSVPVYSGFCYVEQLIPRSSFVNASMFKSNTKLAEYIISLTAKEWQEMRSAGMEFISSKADSIFGAKQYVRSVIAALNYVLDC